MKARVTIAVCALIAAVGLYAQDGGADVAEQGAVIRLLPPDGRELSGRVLFEALLMEPEPWLVSFHLDGVEVERRKFPPWEAKIRLQSPPAEQVVKVQLENRRGEILGSDELRVNRPVYPLRVSIEGLEPVTGGLELAATVSTPEEVELTRVGVYLNDSLVESSSPDQLRDGRLEWVIPRTEGLPTDFVRVEAQLGDGRTIEDVVLVESSEFAEKVDVRLVQLQVLVTDKTGAPVAGLERANFTVRDGADFEEPAGLFVADDVSLLLGLSLDSSGSMEAIWEQTQSAASSFLRRTLISGDRGFLVDFDTGLRLVRSQTEDVTELEAGLAELVPEGGTALFDSILFSLLQFERQQGRRGLVVLTDGYDVNSSSDPKRVIEFGRKLGVPVYILAIDQPGAGVRRGAGGPGATSGFGGAAAVHSLKALTEPTGGRLYRVPSLEHMKRAFVQINAEMRNQYILTYYSESPPAPGEPPQIRVSVPGRKGLKVRATVGADQIY